MFPSSVGLPELPGILVGVFQKDSGVRFVDTVSGMSQAGFAVISPRALFLSIVAWPLMLVILADVDQKDSYAFGSSMFKAGIASYNAPRAVLSLFADARHHGLYGPKGQLQCHFYCWYCW